MCPHACGPQRFRKSLQRPLRVGDEGLRCLLADPNCLKKAEAEIVHHRTHMKATAPIEASTSVSARDAAQVQTCANKMSYVLKFNAF